MSKWSIFGGMVVAGFLLFQFDSGELTVNDVLSIGTQKPVSGDSMPRIYGAVVPTDNAQDFIKTLAKINVVSRTSNDGYVS